MAQSWAARLAGKADIAAPLVDAVLMPVEVLVEPFLGNDD